MTTETSLEKVRDVFSIFHDGGIVAWEGDSHSLRLKMDCVYLAELVHPAYEYFHLELVNVEHLVLEPWMSPAALPQEYFTDRQQIFQAELEINAAEIDRELVKVYCIQHSNAVNYCGGNLYIKCSDIRVFDQGGKEVTVEQLETICRNYWSDFEARSKFT